MMTSVTSSLTSLFDSAWGKCKDLVSWRVPESDDETVDQESPASLIQEVAHGGIPKSSYKQCLVRIPNPEVSEAMKNEEASEVAEKVEAYLVRRPPSTTKIEWPPFNSSVPAPVVSSLASAGLVR